MKILQLCPLWHPISFQTAGGIETLLAQLSPHLTEAGCQLTFIATADSEVTGELVPVVQRSVCTLMQEQLAWSYDVYEQQALRLTVERLAEFDLVHSHIGPNGFLLSSLSSSAPVLHTLHGQVTDDLSWYLRQNSHVVIATVSKFQYSRLTERGVGNPCYVIHNGIDTSKFPLRETAEERILFLGRMEYEKGPDLAIDAAIQTGLPIDIAGPIIQRDFFRSTIEPMLNGACRYVGVVSGARKLELLAGACCMVVPSRWNEPFGMVSIEAMACGTPVVALRSGALPEIIESGVNGFLVDTLQELPDAIRRAKCLDRRMVRESIIERFDISTTTKRYLSLYEALIQDRR